MKQKIDRLAAAVVLGFHTYCDVILGLILTVGSAVLFSLSFSIRIMKEPVSVTDTARFFPQLVFGALILVGIAMFILGLRKVKENRETAPKGQKLADSVQALERGIIVLISIAVFIALMEPIGFIPSAIALKITV